MAFCEFSNEILSSSTTPVDNIFISEFLPNLDGAYVKVYMYGLYKCSTSKDNSLEGFARALQMSSEDILSVYYYLEELGLVNVINIEPVMVKYLPVKNAIQKMKKYNVDKYTAFNISAQELIGSKMLTPREFEELYYLIENLHMEKEAVLKVIEYCVEHKGENVSINYITTVAKNWYHDGVRTSEDVDERLLDQERVSGDVVLVLKALGIKSQASTDEYQMYIGWTKNLEMPLDLIIHIAKKTKTKNFMKLNDLVNKCYSNRLLSEKEVDDYLNSIDTMFSLAKTVVKNLGLWYDNLEVVVDTYVSQWLSLGFESEAIVKLSTFAFKSNIRTLDGLNNSINNMFKAGVLTSASLDNYMQDIVKNDEEIANILHSLGIERSVTSSDRNMYKTWFYDWGMTSDILNFATSMSQGKYLPLQYLNRVLAEYHSAGIRDVESARNYKLSFVGPVASKTKNATTPKSAKKREYSKSELDSLFDDITEIEI